MARRSREHEPMTRRDLTWRAGLAGLMWQCTGRVMGQGHLGLAVTPWDWDFDSERNTQKVIFNYRFPFLFNLNVCRTGRVDHIAFSFLSCCYPMHERSDTTSHKELANTVQSFTYHVDKIICSYCLHNYFNTKPVDIVDENDITPFIV